MSKSSIALLVYWQLLEEGVDKVDACVMAINSVSKTWYEYARIYNEIKGVM